MLELFSQVKGAKLRLWIYRGIESALPDFSPFCSFVNLELKNVCPRLGAVGKQATVLLENPRGDFPLTVEQLKQQVPFCMFNIFRRGGCNEVDGPYYYDPLTKQVRRCIWQSRNILVSILDRLPYK